MDVFFPDELANAVGDNTCSSLFEYKTFEEYDGKGPSEVFHGENTQANQRIA